MMEFKSMEKIRPIPWNSLERSSTSNDLFYRNYDSFWESSSAEGEKVVWPIYAITDASEAHCYEKRLCIFRANLEFLYDLYPIRIKNGMGANRNIECVWHSKNVVNSSIMYAH